MNKIIYPLGAAAILYFLSNDKKPYLSITERLSRELPQTAPIATPDRTVDDGGMNAPTTGLHGDNDVSDARNVPARAIWASAFQLAMNNSRNNLSEAIDLTWQYWNDERNKYLRLFPTKTAMFMNIASYIPNRALDRGSINALPEIKWDSAPLYDSLYNDWYNIPVWNCYDWQYWHMKLEEHFKDTATANQVWLRAWNADENQCYITGVLACPDTDSCRWDCGFVEYLYSKDIPVGNIMSNSYCDLSAIVKNIVKAGTNITQAASEITQGAANLGEGIKNTGSVLGTMMPLAIGGIAALVAYNYANKQAKKGKIGKIVNKGNRFLNKCQDNKYSTAKGQGTCTKHQGVKVKAKKKTVQNGY